MEFSLSPQLRALVEEARDWGVSQVRPAGLEADRTDAPLPIGHAYFKAFMARQQSRQARATLAEAAPEGRVTQAVVLGEEAAYWDRGIGVASPGAGFPAGMVNAAGTPEQKARFLEPFAHDTEPRWASFALTEPQGGSDTAAFRTKAIATERGYILNGAKCFIGNAARADWILVQATLDPTKGRAAQRSLFVERGTPGLAGMKIEKKMGLRSYESVSFVLEDCEVPADNLLGGKRAESDTGAYGKAMGSLNSARIAVASGALGVARAAFDEARRFATQSGAIRSPRIRDKLEFILRRCRAARLATLQAAWLADSQRVNVVEASLAKIVSAEVAQQAAALGMEIVGLEAGAGDNLVEKLFRDAKALDIVEGTGQIQRVIIARNLVRLPR